MAKLTMAPPPIYIASYNATRYQELIWESLGSGVDIGFATAEEDVIANYSGEAIVLGSPDLLATLLATEPPVQWAQSTWAGVTPLIKLPFRGYTLTGVKDVFGAQMGEYVLGYVLAHELKIAARQQAQAEKRWDQSSSSRVEGKTLGVMGTGSIGNQVGLMARQLGLRILGFNSSGKPVEPFERVYANESLATFLRQCDYLVGILPDISATTNLIDVSALQTMKSTALLINVGRGNLIDEQALCKALDAGEIAGAVLDVFKQEPLPEESPLWSATNCTITGHVAAVSRPEDIVELFKENYRLYQNNEPLNHVVDFDKGY
ncbi:MAG: D-2-hydroxyacid dehydrogenase [Pseudomonadales bacterium]|nr:D-2-hydroxyacid dehydrogenase [Pseudomonadales bacterium]